MLMLTQELFGSEDPELKRGKQAPSANACKTAESLKSVVADFKSYFELVTADRRLILATLLANAVMNGEPISDCSGLISPDTPTGGKCNYRGVFHDRQAQDIRRQFQAARRKDDQGPGAYRSAGLSGFKYW
ncbi:hypothetical protein [Pseudomonas moorei]|uniref:hypothetical protein n=1 Tax=Pseudomonas moorei TaxID=395599 RepID=UPI001FF1D952|nr:hypothetical protein [Pseudomonas moorei]